MVWSLQKVKPILQEGKTKIGKKAKIVKIDVDKNPDIAKKYKIQEFPTLIIFENGKSLWRQSGVIPAYQLIELLKEHGAT